MLWKQESLIMHGIAIRKNDILFIKLPSGRCLSYIEPRVKEGSSDPLYIQRHGPDNETTENTGHLRR